MLTQKILTLLANRTAQPTSGQWLAEELGVSRNAVWKAVNRLKEEHYDIEVVPRKGYLLKNQGDILSGESVASFLPDITNDQVIYIPDIGSTNDYAKSLAEQGAEAWTMVLSNRQTAGRGRLGRSFHSPENSGLYMSIILRPRYAAKDASLLTIAAATAVAEAVEAIQEQPVGIKWVNDCYIGALKFAGILTEAAISMEDQTLRYAVVGIGINVYEPEAGFPNALKNVACAVFPARALQQNRRAELAADVCRRFRAYADDLLAAEYMAGYRSRLNMLHRPVQLVSANKTETVVPYDINAQGHLLVRDQNGQERAVQSGEISVRY